MGYFMCWMTFALCVLTFSAAKDSKSTELPMITQFDREYVESDGEGDVKSENEAMMKLLVHDFMDTNPETVNGQPLFEGDMVMTEKQWRALRERKGLTSSTYRWPQGSSGYPVVPYIYTDSRLNTTILEAGLNHWEQHTCITFQTTTNTRQPHLRFIYGDGCYSYVGMINQNSQDVSIGKGCDTLGIVVHEVGHAIGFVHEQSRPDRDDYVVINLENIDTTNTRNFDKYTTSYINTQNILYDYSSDMHYSSMSFSINGKTTIATKDPLAQGLIGQRTGLSHRDKRLANIIYNCTGKWLAKCGLSSDPCQNEGYIGAQCSCVCPPGTSGNNCETKTGGYYDALINPCTEKITQAGTITSPNYPSSYSAGECVKWIEAPECYVPKLTFSNFKLYGRNTHCSGGTLCCYFDALEIRINNTYNGYIYCDADIAPGTNFTGTTREIILYFRATAWWLKGWSAELTFVPQAGCTVTSTAPATTVTTTAEPINAETITTTPTTTQSTIEAPTTTAPSTAAPTTTAPTTFAPIIVSLTTTTTPSTTTSSLDLQCLIKHYGGVSYWTSPRFGVANYPNDFTCGIRGSSLQHMLTLRLESFNLQRRKRRTCVDGVTITQLYGRSITLCGTQKRTVFMSPSFNFLSTFFTDSAITSRGFKISLKATTTSCHRILTPAAGQNGTITSPADEKYCEYRIVAPPGRQVRIDNISSKVLKTKNCKIDWILLNGSSDSMYSPDTSKIICGLTKMNSPMTSTKGTMYVAYQGTKRRSRGFTLTFTVI